MSKRMELLDAALSFHSYCEDLEIDCHSDDWSDEEIEAFLDMKATYWKIHNARMAKLMI